jgi:hypothetical protein
MPKGIGSRPSQTGGSYAARAAETSVLRVAGYQRSKVGRRSSFSTWARTCNSRWAPFLVQRIYCFFTKRLLITWFTVDSTNAVEMTSP